MVPLFSSWVLMKMLVLMGDQKGSMLHCCIQHPLVVVLLYLVHRQLVAHKPGKSRTFGQLHSIAFSISDEVYLPFCCPCQLCKVENWVFLQLIKQQQLDGKDHIV